MPARSPVPADDVLRRAIEASSSYEDASKRLQLSKTCVREHAERLGVRTRWRSGRERLPDDATLRALFADARRKGGLAGLKRKLGLGWEAIHYHAARLGMDPTVEIRAGLPDDKTLRLELEFCASFADVARRYGVYEHTIRNQGRRLGVASPTKR